MGVEEAGGPVNTGRGEDLAAGDVSDFETAEIECDARAGGRRAGRSAVGLERADAGQASGGVESEFAFRGKGGIAEGTGDDGAVALEGENAVNGQTRVAHGAAGWNLGGHVFHGGAQLIEALAAAGANGHDGRVFEKTTPHEVGDFQFDQREKVGVDEVGFRQHDHATRDPEQAADLKVFDGLRLHAFVGGDNQEDDIDARDAGEHVFDEAFVAGDVDEGGVASGWEREVCEAEFDGDAAAFLLGEAVRVDAGEGGDEGRFAVIDVAGGAEDQRVHGAEEGLTARKCSMESESTSEWTKWTIWAAKPVSRRRSSQVWRGKSPSTWRSCRASLSPEAWRRR